MLLVPMMLTLYRQTLHTGVVCLVQVVDGKIKEGDRISAISLGACA